MLLSSITFFSIIAIIVIICGGSFYWFLHEKKQVSFNLSIGVGVFVALIAGIAIFSQRTNVIVIEADETKQLTLLGSTDFKFKNGSTEKLSKLNHGNLVINNTTDTCVIIRSDYNDDLSSEDEDLLNFMLMVKPQSVFNFHGKEIDYLFIEAPEYLEVRENTSSYALVKYELQYLHAEDWENFSIYDGPVKYGLPSGYGTYYFEPTNNYYQGDMVAGRFQGHGKLVYGEFEWYEGDFEDDSRSGEGFYHYPDSSTYQGGWLDGKKEGYGVRHHADGDVYEGDYVDGTRNGLGKYTFVDGDYYEGEFLDGDFHGHGKWFYASSETFKEGEWFEDEYMGE